MRRPVLAAGVLSLLLAANGATPQQPQDAAFTPIEPCRLVDTRESQAARTDPAPAYGPPRLRPGVARSILVAGQCGVPAEAHAVQLDVVATQTVGRGYLVVYPSEAVGPALWSLDYRQGRPAAASAVVVGLGSGGFDLIARGSATHLVIDVVGYYIGRPTAPGEGID